MNFAKKTKKKMSQKCISKVSSLTLSTLLLLSGSKFSSSVISASNSFNNEIRDVYLSVNPNPRKDAVKLTQESYNFVSDSYQNDGNIENGLSKERYNLYKSLQGTNRTQSTSDDNYKWGSLDMNVNNSIFIDGIMDDIVSSFEVVKYEIMENGSLMATLSEPEDVSKFRDPIVISIYTDNDQYKNIIQGLSKKEDYDLRDCYGILMGDMDPFDTYSNPEGTYNLSKTPLFYIK